ncbi:MAG TPA: hypothetical protein VMZ91_16735, partial [Candidatus Paceibacterota bacterium]|nr:hypothetical protein [Candidatus Paceibacterota bacterium]
MNKKLFFIVCLVFLVLTFVVLIAFLLIPNSLYNIANISQSTLNPNPNLATINLGQSGLSQYKTTGNFYYKILPRTGNESLYSISFREVEVYNHSYQITEDEFGEPLKDPINVSVNRTDTIICAVAEFEEKELNISTGDLSSFTTTYSVPETISFYKTNELSKQPDLERELIKENELSLTPNDFEEGDEYRFCYQANKEKDFYLKFGDNSIVIILEAEVVSDSLLSDVIAETGDANFTHLNISDTAPYDSLVGYWNFDGDAEDTLTTTHY